MFKNIDNPWVYVLMQFLFFGLIGLTLGAMQMISDKSRKAKEAAEEKKKARQKASREEEDDFPGDD